MSQGKAFQHRGARYEKARLPIDDEGENKEVSNNIFIGHLIFNFCNKLSGAIPNRHLKTVTR